LNKGLWSRACGTELVEQGLWNRACGTGLVEQGLWSRACGTGLVEQGLWNMACGTWRVEQGLWNRACGTGLVEQGFWSICQVDLGHTLKLFDFPPPYPRHMSAWKMQIWQLHTFVFSLTRLCLEGFLLSILKVSGWLWPAEVPPPPTSRFPQLWAEVPPASGAWFLQAQVLVLKFLS